MSEDASAAPASLALGVLGAAAPGALAFLASLQAFTPARCGRDHIRVLVDINPKLPDRSLPGAGPAMGPGPALAEMAGALQGAGAEVLVIASHSAHAHADLVQRAAGLPLIDMIETAANGARDAGVRRVGVLGVRGALRLHREYLAAQAMGLVSLDAERQEEFAATLARIKAGERGAAVRREMAGYAADLVGAGAELVVAGAMEVPLVIGPGDVAVPFIDPGELLARRCVAVCLGLEPAPALPG